MTLSRKGLIGYSAGVLTGVTYGTNPLMAKPLMADGTAVETILFYRYAIAVAILSLFFVAKRQRIAVGLRQAGVLLVAGLLYTSSSLMLFLAYEHIASGVATTLVFLSPVIVALIMMFCGKIPSVPVWIAIAVSFIGVVIMSGITDGSSQTDYLGVCLAIGSAVAYSFFMVIINRNKTIAPISSTVLTFYTLIVGAAVFFIIAMTSGSGLTAGLNHASAWLNLTGLAVVPTIISTASLAVATRNIGATKASILEVFEPITAILIGAVAFGEPITFSIIAGITISVAAVTYMIAVTAR